MKTALLVIEMLIGLVVIAVVLMQPSKSDALSGLIQGSSTDTFYSKNKSRTKEVMLERLTVVSMLLYTSNGKPVLVFYNFKHDKVDFLKYAAVLSFKNSCVFLYKND